jgi:vacuolar-type H+-ATPase subunit I/STV1
MENQNGKTTQVGGGCDKRICQNQQGGLGEAGNYSPVNGNEEQSGFIEGDCSRGNTVGTNYTYGNTPSGKILQRLDKLEETHYEYVHAHQNRLQARLDESKKLEDEFRKEAAKLRQEILALATQGAEEIEAE